MFKYLKKILPFVLISPLLTVITITACTPANKVNIQYSTNIHNTNTEKVLLLIDSSLQAYKAFNEKTPAKCQTAKITTPSGYEFIEDWTGIDSLFGKEKTEECYGVIFRTKAAPYTYIFAFRGTASLLDVLDDMGAEAKTFIPFDKTSSIPNNIEVESGFFNVYHKSGDSSTSMQEQLFSLLDKYNASNKPITELYITGHSLGSSLSELFTLDIAISRPEIKASTINFASPRVGNAAFIAFYQQQVAQKQADTRTLRVQNVYDKVPCTPLRSMGYQHLDNAYLVAFHKKSFLGREDLLSCHSSDNYHAVLHKAAESSKGVYITNSLNVPANGYDIVSDAPDSKLICNY